MSLSEQETRVQLIDPALKSSGWTAPLIHREYPYRKGRVRLVGEEAVRDEPQFADYVLRGEPNGLPVAVVEAKSEDHSVGAGLQQAIAYARDLRVRFAYSSNGHGFVEQDLATASVRSLTRIPAPDDLKAMLATRPTLGPRVTNRRGVLVDNPVVHPAFVDPTGKKMRYYQEASVSAALEELVIGKDRALIVLATAAGKTFIAANLAWKAWKSGFARKILFLTDRISLHGQAYNDFAVFGDARGVVRTEDLPLQRDVHFATYQTLYWTADGEATFEKYPQDYFDLVIVDECHRSGYGDWGAILEHFAPAFHLGMTATPKRSDSIDTFEFFASENLDEEGQPTPTYEYSLGQGIEDGFLATYRVHNVVTDLDAEGTLIVEDAVAKGAELFVPEEAATRDAYSAGLWEKEIVIPDRTRLLVQDLVSKLRSWGVNEKTVVFCATIEHADQVRQQIQNTLGPHTGKQLYAARIVGEERDAQALLEEFQRSDATEPVVVTTVDLLTTGVNIPALKNVVFMKHVASPTLFKQIIGRGSRIDDRTGKKYFRIIDYTGATRLFDAWDVPGSGLSYDGPVQGNASIRGTVVDAKSDEGISGASVVVRVGRKDLAESLTDDRGDFEMLSLPDTLLTVVAGARDYSHRRLSIEPAAPESQEIVFALIKRSDRARRVVISGIEVTIAEETVLSLEVDGRQLTITEYRDFVGENVANLADDPATLRELWRDPIKRQQLRESLAERSVDPAVLGLVTDRTDCDDYDLLTNAAFGSRMRTREERARRVEHEDVDFLAQYTEDQQEIVRHLLDKYRLNGVDEIASSKVFRLSPFSESSGGITAIAEIFGGSQGLGELLKAVQRHLYPTGEDVA